MIEKKVKEILAQQLGIVQDKILSNSHLVNDLGADSLDLVEIVMSLEVEFRVKLEDKEYHAADTVLKVSKLIESKLRVE